MDLGTKFSDTLRFAFQPCAISEFHQNGKASAGNHSTMLSVPFGMRRLGFPYMCKPLLKWRIVCHESPSCRTTDGAARYTIGLSIEE
jgi:hypothetical protein